MKTRFIWLERRIGSSCTFDGIRDRRCFSAEVTCFGAAYAVVDQHLTFSGHIRWLSANSVYCLRWLHAILRILYGRILVIGLTTVTAFSVVRTMFYLCQFAGIRVAHSSEVDCSKTAVRKTAGRVYNGSRSY